MNHIKTGAVHHLNSREFQLKQTANPNAVILDVRTPSEFLGGKIPGAININVMDVSFMQKISTLDKSKVYFVYCLSGARSNQACAMMANIGFEVYNLTQGISGWTGEIC